MAQGENASKPHGNEDFWSKRLRGWHTRTTWWKRWTHRIERRRAKHEEYVATRDPHPVAECPSAPPSS